MTRKQTLISLRQLVYQQIQDFVHSITSSGQQRALAGVDGLQPGLLPGVGML